MDRSVIIDLREEAYQQGLKLEESGRFAEAAQRYLLAASQGHDGAQLNLGNIFDDRLVPSRPVEARKWYRRAAMSGYAPAAWNLALHYRKTGKVGLYHRWLKKAAALGDEDAAEEVDKLERDGNNHDDAFVR